MGCWFESRPRGGAPPRLNWASMAGSQQGRSCLERLERRPGRGDYLSFIHDWKAHWTIAVLRMPLCSYSREIRAMNREVYFGLSLFVLKSKVQHESIRRPEIDERACFHFSMKWTEKEIPNQRFLEKPRMKSFYAVSCMLFCAWRI